MEKRRLPRAGLVRRHVHGEHDGGRGRGASGCRCPGSASPPAVDPRRDEFARASRRGGASSACGCGLRPRDVLTREAFENAIAVRDGVRRVDERGAAPAGDRRRGRRRARAGRLRPDQPADAAHRRPAPGGAVRHGRPRPGRRRAGAHAGAARGGAAARRRADGDRARRSRRTCRSCRRRRSTATWCGRVGEPIHPTAGSPILARVARARRRGRQDRRAWRGRRSGARRACSTPRRRRSRRSRAAGSCAGDVIVIRYEGPQGRPGDARDAGRHRRRSTGPGWAATSCWSPTGGSAARRTGSAIAPHRAGGGGRRADRAGARRATRSRWTWTRAGSTWTVEEDELDRRRDGWKAPQPRYERGALAKYARLVASASRGAICG